MRKESDRSVKGLEDKETKMSLASTYRKDESSPDISIKMRNIMGLLLHFSSPEKRKTHLLFSHFTGKKISSVQTVPWEKHG